MPVSGSTFYGNDSPRVALARNQYNQSLHWIFRSARFPIKTKAYGHKALIDSHTFQIL